MADSVYEIIFNTVVDGATNALTRSVIKGALGLFKKKETVREEPPLHRTISAHDKRMAQAYMLSAMRVYEKEQRHSINYEFEATFHLHQAAKELAKAHALDPNASVVLKQGTPDEYEIDLDTYAANLCSEEAMFYHGMAKGTRLTDHHSDPEFHLNVKGFLKEKLQRQQQYSEKAKAAIEHALTLSPNNLYLIQNALEVYKEYNSAYWEKPRYQQTARYEELKGQAFALDPYNARTLEITR